MSIDIITGTFVYSTTDHLEHFCMQRLGWWHYVCFQCH